MEAVEVQEDIQIELDRRDLEVVVDNVFFDHRMQTASWTRSRKDTYQDSIGKRPPIEACNVYMGMKSFTVEEGLKVTASQENIGLKVGRCRAHVNEMTKALEAWGWLKLLKNRQKDHLPNEYLLTKPQWVRQANRPTKPLSLAPPCRRKRQALSFQATSLVVQNDTKGLRSGSRSLGVGGTSTVSGEVPLSQPESKSPPPPASPSKPENRPPDNLDPAFQQAYKAAHGHDYVWTEKERQHYATGLIQHGAGFLRAWKNYLRDQFWKGRKNPLSGFVAQPTNWASKPVINCADCNREIPADRRTCCGKARCMDCQQTHKYSHETVAVEAPPPNLASLVPNLGGPVEC